MSEWSARAASRARAAALARTRTPRTSSGKRTSATWPLLAPFHQAHNALGGQPPNRFARRACGKVDILRQPRNRKPQPPLSFQVAVSQKCIYTMWSITPSRSCGTTTSSTCFHSAFASISLCALWPPLSPVPVPCRLLTVDCRLREAPPSSPAFPSCRL